MKLPVPLMIPQSHSMRFPASPSRIALMIGMPPATAASKATMTPRAWAASKTSLPWMAMSALLAVTTCLPFWMARKTSVRAGSSPPMSSTTIRTSGSSTTAVGSSVSTMPSSARSRGLSRSRTLAQVISMARPARRLISS